MAKVLIATEKPFAPAAVAGIKEVIEKAGHELVLLEKYTEKKQLLEAVADVNAIIIRSDKIDAEVLDAAKELKIVVRAGAGYDNVDLAAATSHNVVVENTPGQNSNAVAELVLGLLVYTVRNFYNGKAGTELMGKTLGILAFGNVGRNVARIAKGFGMNVIAYDAFCPAEAIEAAGVKAMASQAELFKEADIKPDADAEFAAFEGRYFSTPKKMGAQTAEANSNAGIAAANQINAYFADGCTKFQVNK